MKTKVWLVLVYIFIFSGSASADKIYLQDNPKGNTGQVMEEYPDAIIIKFPKNEIKRIEAEEMPPTQNTSSRQQVIWIDDGDTITLRLPKQSVQVTGAQGLESMQNTQTAGPTETWIPESKPAQSIKELTQLALSSDRVIQGKVLKRGDPLANCKIRILKITNTAQNRVLNLLTGSQEEEEEDSFEAVTDEHGLYTFSNIPYGEYILYWKPEGMEHWVRKLSENPDITLVPGRPVAVKDIEANVRTVN